MKATKLFKQYRNAPLGLPKEDYRALQRGEDVKVDPEVVEKYPLLFEKSEKKKVEVKNGSK